MKQSISENNGLACLTEAHENVYSVGISTGGIAEIRMAKLLSSRQIIATTIDKQGATFAEKSIKTSGLSNQITVKIEDVAAPLPYDDETFDYIYARLVLHYLPRDALIRAVKELYRILKKGSQLFVVVRSTDCVEDTSSFDPISCLTTCTSQGIVYSRYFHTEDSIQTYLTAVGFTIEKIKSYAERLCVDFKRTQPSPNVDSLIEVLASK